MSHLITWWSKNNKYGKVAIEGTRIIGYLTFLGPWDGFIGRCKGAFGPLGASAFGGKERGKTASMLLAQVADEMTQNDVTSIALKRYCRMSM